MSRLFSSAIDQAKQILDRNWTGSFTKPAPLLYPHQWNWDSGFIAIGRSHYDLPRAMLEIQTLFDAQWKNGMLPQIVFNPEGLGHYFPEPDFWQTQRCPNSPAEKLTSGITMPPIHAVAVEKIFNQGRRRRDVASFIERIYPKLLAFHAYLYRERDPHDEGLVYIRHPWESGIDNSPTWDVPLKRIQVGLEALPPYERKDLEHGVDPAMRPSDEDYARYVYLVDLFRRLDYDEERIREQCPFLIQDTLFNCVLCRANESLARIAAKIGEPTALPLLWAEKTSGAIQEKLWNSGHRIFDCYDLVSRQAIEVDTAAGFLPLFAGAADTQQAECLYGRLNSSSFCALHQGNCFTVPNYDTQKDGFDRLNYWRGPVWININWMLAHGLRRYGYTLKADSLQKDLLQLPLRFGFHEYFDSFEGTGYGSEDFSWTAALFIDLVEDFYTAEKRSKKLVTRVRSFLGSDVVLNAGHDMPPVSGEEIAAHLMRSIKDLRDGFYDPVRGRVDYDRLRESSEYTHYRRLTNALRKFDLRCLVGRGQKLAFWINLYNTIVVDGIVTENVTRSVREAPGLFRRLKYAIGEYLFSADDIEHGVLRANARPWFHPARAFGPRDPRKAFMVSPVDPRIHFALVCGSRSCAPIEYYDAKSIYEQLETAARGFVNSSEVIVVPEQSKVMLSEIFRWYERDFGGRQGIVDFLYDYLVDASARKALRRKGPDLSFEYIYYDWSLNR